MHWQNEEENTTKAWAKNLTFRWWCEDNHIIEGLFAVLDKVEVLWVCVGKSQLKSYIFSVILNLAWTIVFFDDYNIKETCQLSKKDWVSVLYIAAWIHENKDGFPICRNRGQGNEIEKNEKQKWCQPRRRHLEICAILEK
jgi:hypothetical protein